MFQLRIYQPWPAAVTVPAAALKALGGSLHSAQVRVWIAASNRAEAAWRLSVSFQAAYRRRVLHEPFSEDLAALLAAGRLLTPGEMYLTREAPPLGETPVVEALGPGRFRRIGELHLSTGGRFVPFFVPRGA